MIYYSDKKKVYGGVNPSRYFVIVADKVADLLAFQKRHHGSISHLPKDFQDAQRRSMDPELRPEPDSRGITPIAKGTREALASLAGAAIHLSLSIPDRGKGMYKSKTPIRLLLPEHQEFLLERENVCQIPDSYVPVLNMMMREQYSHLSGVGVTEESRKFFEREIRGKIIDLCRSGTIVDFPEDSRLENLNNQLAKIDLGRRSDLKFSSTQSPRSADISSKFAAGEGTRRQGRVEEPKEVALVAPEGKKAFKDYLKDLPAG
jgi:hypothetical protein